MDTPNQNLLLRSLRIDWDEIGRDSYLREIPAIAELQEFDFDHSVTFFVGENGSGKSTLLEAIAISYGFNPEGGTRNYRFSTYDSHSELSRDRAVAVSHERAVSSRRAGGGFVPAASADASS